MKLLGIDYGMAKVGLAIADSEAKVATPLCIVRFQTETDLLVQLRDIITKESIDQVVIGLPVNEQVKTPQYLREVEQFIERLRQSVGVPVITEDERFSTQAAQKLMTSSRQPDDAIAAMVILQTYLDRQ